MATILLGRHTESFANKRNFTAFGNFDSPLTPQGEVEAKEMGDDFKDLFSIVPALYDKPVASSAFKRPQQTAQLAGFKHIDVLPLINESDVDREVGNGQDVIRRHKDERWVPEETQVRAAEMFEHIKKKELNYEIYFTHGMFIAGFLLECEVRSVEVPVPFHSKRGYIPLRGSITKIEIPT